MGITEAWFWGCVESALAHLWEKADGAWKLKHAVWIDEHRF